MQNTPIRSKTTEMKIGKTTYIVTSSFDKSANETVNQKLVRYVADRIIADTKADSIGIN